MHDEEFSVKNVLIGAAGAIPLFLPLELLGLGNAAIVAGIAAGITGYVYGDEIAEFAQKKLPQLQEDPKHLMRWLASRPGQHVDEKETTVIDEQQTVKLVQESPQPKTALPARRAIDERIPSSDVEETRIEREHWSFDDDDEYEDDPTPVLPGSSEKVLFSSILANGFVPSLNKIYLANHPDGTPIYVAAKDLCHVALAGATGNGKSSIMRLLMTQLCKIRVRVLLLNPHYTRFDRDSGEDWTPFEKYLEKSPMECAEYAKIGECLQWMAKTELPKRIQRVREGKAAGRPFFVVIDELPAIVGEVRDAPVYISKLLREGRKYGIFLIVASQDFLVKTTGMDGGAVRKCFRTAFYVGGDGATARALLETGSPIAETKLGKGVIAIRCKDTQEAVEARVPYVDNESVYQMLGPSTFADGRPQTDELNEDSLSYVQLFEQYEQKSRAATREQEDEEVNSPWQERTSSVLEAAQDEEPQNIILGKDASITKEQFALAIKLREKGASTGYRDLMDFFDLSEHHAKALNTKIRQTLGLEAK